MAGALAVFKANMIDAQRLRDELANRASGGAAQRTGRTGRPLRASLAIVETVTVSSGDLNARPAV
jgi:hypothetical protein